MAAVELNLGRSRVTSADLILLGVNGVLLVGSVIMVARRRHLQPLRFRDPSLLIAAVTATFLSNCCALAIVEVDYPHCLISMITFVPLLASMVLICARFWKLLLASYLTQARLGQRTSSWILRHPWVSSSSAKLWQASAVVAGVLVLVEVALGMSSPACAQSDRVYVYTSSLMMAYWMAIAVMTWQLRGIRDGFFVVRELTMLGVVILLTNVVLIVNIGMGGGRPPPLPVTISSILQLIIQTWYPLWKSYQMAVADCDAASDLTNVSDAPALARRLQRTGLAPDCGLLDVLRHPDGFEAMKRFLTLEFSIENLFCWQQLHAMQGEQRPGPVRSHFRAVYESFVRAGAPNEVNICSQLKKHFQDVIKERTAVHHEAVVKTATASVVHAEPGAGMTDPDTDVRLYLLQQLYRETVRLMQMDSFQRFKQTAEFQALIRGRSADPITPAG